jgi:hypothetical protein
MRAVRELDDAGCAGLAEVAGELALGALTGRERAEALAHLDRCVACQENVRRLMTTGEELLRLLPSWEPPAGFETRVLERLGLAGGGCRLGRRPLVLAGRRLRRLGKPQSGQ